MPNDNNQSAIKFLQAIKFLLDQQNFVLKALELQAKGALEMFNLIFLDSKMRAFTDRLADCRQNPSEIKLESLQEELEHLGAERRATMECVQKGWAEAEAFIADARAIFGDSKPSQGPYRRNASQSERPIETEILPA